MSNSLLARFEDIEHKDPLDADECVRLAYWMIRTGYTTRSPHYAQWAEDVLDDMGLK